MGLCHPQDRRARAGGGAGGGLFLHFVRLRRGPALYRIEIRSKLPEITLHLRRSMATARVRAVREAGGTRHAAAPHREGSRNPYAQRPRARRTTLRCASALTSSRVHRSGSNRNSVRLWNSVARPLSAPKGGAEVDATGCEMSARERGVAGRDGGDEGKQRCACCELPGRGGPGTNACIEGRVGGAMV